MISPPQFLLHEPSCPGALALLLPVLFPRRGAEAEHHGARGGLHLVQQLARQHRVAAGAQQPRPVLPPNDPAGQTSVE